VEAFHAAISRDSQKIEAQFTLAKNHAPVIFFLNSDGLLHVRASVSSARQNCAGRFPSGGGRR
jgi:hypothetical protein